MSVWYFPVEKPPRMTRCEICGKEIERQTPTRLVRICRFCLSRAFEKRAA